MFLVFKAAAVRESAVMYGQCLGPATATHQFLRPCSSLQEEAAREEAMYNRHHDPPSTADASSVPPLPDAVKLGFLKDPR